VQRGLDAGLLINVTAERVVRLLPALNFSADEGRELVERLSVLIRAFLSS
jgi:acetylornithine aminotransferase